MLPVSWCLRLAAIRENSTSHRTAAGHLTRPGILPGTVSALCCLSVCWLVGLLLSTSLSLPREPAESDDGEGGADHWIRMPCALFLCSGQRRSASSGRRPACRGLVCVVAVSPAGERPNASCSRNLPGSAPPPGGAFCGAFFLPPLAPASLVTANQGCDVDATPIPHPNLPHPPARNWEVCDVCFCLRRRLGQPSLDTLGQPIRPCAARATDHVDPPPGRARVAQRPGLASAPSSWIGNARGLLLGPAAALFISCPRPVWFVWWSFQRLSCLGCCLLSLSLSPFPTRIRLPEKPISGLFSSFFPEKSCKAIPDPSLPTKTPLLQSCNRALPNDDSTYTRDSLTVMHRLKDNPRNRRLD